MIETLASLAAGRYCAAIFFTGHHVIAAAHENLFRGSRIRMDRSSAVG